MEHSSYIPVEIADIKKNTADTKSFLLKYSSDHSIPYKPGQFLTLVFTKNGIEERRSYSISSTPGLGEPLTITVKRIDNGEYSRKLFDTAQIGDVLYTIGASGYFTLPENIQPYDQIFFLAAGSGITPILPLMKTILMGKVPTQVHLIYSNRSEHDCIFFEEINRLINDYPTKLQVEFLFSSSKNLMRARLTKLLLLQFINEKIIRKESTLFYICGPLPYMQMATITLLTEGIAPENIRKENFNTEKPVVKELPPDVNPHRVKILVAQKEYEIVVQYPDTILQTAKRGGIMLPYSCEAGKCGTCSATCLRGKVWHSYNEVLLDRELEKGRVLTCTGYPYGEEDLILTFPELSS
jgi:ferredoxin-NADP reductase